MGVVFDLAVTRDPWIRRVLGGCPKKDWSTCSQVIINDVPGWIRRSEVGVLVDWCEENQPSAEIAASTACGSVSTTPNDPDVNVCPT